MTAANDPWIWLDEAVIRAVHDEQLSEHGGASGIRDAGLLASALRRPQNLAGYGSPDLADIGASYGYGIARNHPFVDGNKRTVFVAVELCLLLNGHSLAASDAECVLTILDLAAGQLEEQAFAAWIRAHMPA